MRTLVLGRGLRGGGASTAYVFRCISFQHSCCCGRRKERRAWRARRDRGGMKDLDLAERQWGNTYAR